MLFRSSEFKQQELAYNYKNKIQTEKKEKIQKIFNSIEEIKDTLADMISEFDEENTTEEQMLDALTEALDALEDASEVIADVL